MPPSCCGLETDSTPATVLISCNIYPSVWSAYVYCLRDVMGGLGPFQYSTRRVIIRSRKFRSHEKVYRRLSINAVKFQMLNINCTVSNRCEILEWGILSNIGTTLMLSNVILAASTKRIVYAPCIICSFQALSCIIIIMNLWCHQKKYFPRYWSFVRGIHRSPMDSPHKGRWRGVLGFSLICVLTNGWVNICTSYDITVMCSVMADF